MPVGRSVNQLQATNSASWKNDQLAQIVDSTVVLLLEYYSSPIAKRNFLQDLCALFTGDSMIDS
jgi:hypothetical protein